MASAVTKRVLTPVFRMSHPHVIDPKPYMENGVQKGEKRFQLDMIYTPADLAKFRAEDGSGNLVEVDIKALAVQAVREQFPALVDTNAFKGAFLKGDGTPGKGWPFKDGATFIAEANAKRKAKNKAELDAKIVAAFTGNVVINAKSYENVKPLLSKLEQNGEARALSRISDVDMKLAKELFVGGSYAAAELSLRPSLVSGTYYVSFYINAIRFIREGEKFGQGNSMMERFGGTYGGESQKDPTQGMNDEIPF